MTLQKTEEDQIVWLSNAGTRHVDGENIYHDDQHCSTLHKELVNKHGTHPTLLSYLPKHRVCIMCGPDRKNRNELIYQMWLREGLSTMAISRALELYGFSLTKAGVFKVLADADLRQLKGSQSA